ncbi:DUF3572 domain-containing protein [Emcibacter sp. SYSU 3D8]|uniref:DUF3572 domain-containing protein n=1 Tax=Emcibacter sp. SYSU 3D8 TaxID=3133969 RepID=UPI0031FE95C3
MNTDRAETVALQALAFLAADEQALDGFVHLTGLGLDQLRAAASNPEILAGVLDHLLQDEPLLLAFCEAADIKPDEPARARAYLPGGDLPHYT